MKLEKSWLNLYQMVHAAVCKGQSKSRRSLNCYRIDAGGGTIIIEGAQVSFYFFFDTSLYFFFDNFFICLSGQEGARAGRLYLEGARRQLREIDKKNCPILHFLSVV